MADGARTYLITGVTGFLGKVLLEELLRRRDELRIARVLVVIRPLRGYNAQQRFDREVAASPCLSRLAPGWEPFVRVAEADLELPGLPATLTEHPDLRDVTHIVHAAASTRFNLPLALAARANVHATLSMLTLAQTIRGLQRFIYVSTAYATPYRDGQRIEETLVDLPAPAAELFARAQGGAGGAGSAGDAGDAGVTSGDGDAALLRRSGHPNTYTLTKAIAERLVADRRGALPVTIVRPSIVTASRSHPFPGWIDSNAGFAGFVMLTGSGYMRALVCDPEARLDLIPVDDVATRIVRASTTDTEPFAIRHLVVGPAQSPTVTHCWDETQRYFRAHRVARIPGGRYLGPRNFGFRIADFLQHRLPLTLAGLASPTAFRRAAKMRAKLAMQNREFAYFTTRTFDFATSMPMDAGFDGARFVEVVDAGVHEYLMTARSG